jgi:ATP-dependent phosphoenolpyruvate carboxykinase
MLPEHIASVEPHIYNTTISDVGALSVSSGLRTGRSPKDKRVVLDETTKDVIINFALKLLLNRPFGGEASIFLFLQKDMQETEREQLISSMLDQE